jgi:hypothetical protein
MLRPRSRAGKAVSLPRRSEFAGLFAAESGQNRLLTANKAA